MTLEERIDAARIEWETWSARKAANKVKTTADWHLYQRAMWTYEAVLNEEIAVLKEELAEVRAENAVLLRRREALTR